MSNRAHRTLWPTVLVAALSCVLPLSVQAQSNVTIYGAVDVAELTPNELARYLSLLGTAHMPTYAIRDADMVLNGAHSSPMRSLLADGKNNFWVAGDWGRSDHRSLDGNTGAGEVGFGRGVGSTTVKIALGRTYGEQSIGAGGIIKNQGTYVVPELTAAIPNTPLYATITGYYNDGVAKIKRGHITSLALIYTGEPFTPITSDDASTRTAAVRVRFDWMNALEFGASAFTPYASVTRYRTKIGSYSESSEDITMQWESHKELSTQASLGFDMVHRVNDKLNVLGRLDGVHRFESRGTDQTIEMGSIPGLAYKQNWMRVGIGAESKIGHGTGSLMLNATTEGEAQSWWIAANYRWDF